MQTKITIQNRTIYSDGKVELTLSGAIDALNAGADISTLRISDERDISLYNKYTIDYGFDQLPVHQEIDHQVNQRLWFFPDEYFDIDLSEYFLNKCRTDIERIRVQEELARYELGGLTDLLRCAIWLVDTMNDNNLFWGVGRGSSVSSYCLYLIGLHMVDSIKYGLNIKDFIKIKEDIQ